MASVSGCRMTPSLPQSARRAGARAQSRAVSVSRSIGVAACLLEAPQTSRPLGMGFRAPLPADDGVAS